MNYPDDLPSEDRSSVSAFLAAIEDWKAVLSHARVSFFAAGNAGDVDLSYAEVVLHSGNLIQDELCYGSSRVLAGRYDICLGKERFVEFLEGVLRGELQSPKGIVRLPKTGGAPYRATSSIRSSAAIPNQIASTLSVTGDRKPNLYPTNAYDWELRSATPPFDGIADLLQEVGLTIPSGDLAQIEIVVLPPVTIQSASLTESKSARVAISLMAGLDRDHTSINLIARGPDGTCMRSCIVAKSIEWFPKIDNDHMVTGQIVVPLKPGSVVRCIALYRGRAYHYGWISDPDFTQNPYIALYRVFDPSLDDLKRQLQISELPTGTKIDSRRFESAVARLFWLGGFSCVQLGNFGISTDGPDLIAMTPRGNVMVVECTTGPLANSGKDGKLLSRVEQVRDSITRIGIPLGEVAPVFVTSLPESHVRPDIAEMNRKGILVVTRDTLWERLGYADSAPQPDEVFRQAVKSIEHARIMSR